MALSTQQINVFNTFGYLNFPGLFADSIEKIIEEFETIWVNNGGGHFNQEHDYEQRWCCCKRFRGNKECI